MAVGTSFTRGNPNIALIAFAQINTCSFFFFFFFLELAEITKRGTCNPLHSSTFHLSGYFPVNQVKNCSPHKMMHSRTEIFLWNIETNEGITHFSWMNAKAKK